jgi:hypothetical protein
MPYACSEAGFSSQNADCARGNTTEEQRYDLLFCVCVCVWEKGLCTKYIRKEMFSDDGGKCLSRKAVHIWAEKLSQNIRNLQTKLRH